MMKSELAKKLRGLGQRRRNEIWLQRILRRLTPLFWYGAIIFFLAGGIHQLLLPLNFLLITGIAFIPSLLFLCFLSVTQKPTRQEAAADADKLFGANSLFVSAWELTRFESEIKGTEKLLLDRCETALPEWSRPIRQLSQGNLKPSGLITITLGIAGLFFLLQPSHVQPQQTSSDTPNSHSELANEDRVNAVKILSKLLDDNVTPTIQTPGLPADSTTPSDSSRSAPVQSSIQIGQSAESASESVESISAADKRLSLLINKPAATLAELSPASTPSGGEKITDNGAGNETADAPGSNVIQTETYDQIQLVNIETGSDHRSSATDELNQGNKLLASKPEQAVFRQSANHRSRQISANGFTYLLSPQQRNLVWRYFVQLDKIDDPKQ